MKTSRKQRLKVKFWIVWFALTNVFRKTYLANICQHKTKREGSLVSFGQRYVLGMALTKNKRPDYCLKCVAKMAIRCAWCGEPIHIGDKITLYLQKPDMECLKDSEWLKYVRAYQPQPTDPVAMVGCPRRGCADTSGDYCGQWLPPGRVQRQPSIFERFDAEVAALAANGECGVLLAKV